MGHEDDGFGAMVAGVFDGGKGTNDALIVGDFLVRVEGNVKVDLQGDCQVNPHIVQ